MKLAACYTVFNGLDMLKKSIDQIFNHVDYVIIAYQTVSNTGNENIDLLSQLEPYERIKNVVLIEFNPKLTIHTKQNERNKHNLLLQKAIELGCSHFFISACDHFYDENEFKYAKKQCEIENLDVSFTAMYTYYKHPTYQITPIEAYFMPFIIKIHESTCFDKIKGFPVYVDPALQINTFRNWRTFNHSEIMLHHYSMIRKDIKEKFINAAASVRWSPQQKERFISEYEKFDIEKNTDLEYFGKRKCKIVDNYFNL